MNNLKEQRQKAGLTQEQLATKSGVSIRTIQQYEYGFRNIDGAKINTLLDLSKAIGCKISDILNDAKLKDKVYF